MLGSLLGLPIELADPPAELLLDESPPEADDPLPPAAAVLPLDAELPIAPPAKALVLEPY
jgi:hypothetical protein